MQQAITTPKLFPGFHKNARLAFAFCPNGAIRKEFLFPDRDNLLEAVDGILAGLERGPPMFGRDDDGHAGFPNFKAAQTMNHGDAINRKLLLRLGPQLFHLANGHGLVRLIFQIERGAAVRMVAHKPFENHHSTVARGPQRLRQIGSGNRIARDAIEIVARTAAYGGHEGHLVTIAQGGGSVGNLLIDRKQQRASHRKQLGETTLIAAPEALQGFALGEFHLLLRATRQVVGDSEKQHVDFHISLKTQLTISNSDAYLLYTPGAWMAWRNPLPAVDELAVRMFEAELSRRVCVGRIIDRKSTRLNS